MIVTRSKVVLVGVVTAVALTAGVAVAATTTASGGALTAVKVVRSSNAADVGSDGFQTIPGAVTSMSVPSGTKALLVMRVTMVNKCEGPSSAQYCRLRVLVNGVPAEPNEPGPIIETPTPEKTGFEMHAFDFSKSVGAGTYKIEVQTRAAEFTGTASVNHIQGFHLTVERFKG